MEGMQVQLCGGPLNGETLVLDDFKEWLCVPFQRDVLIANGSVSHRGLMTSICWYRLRRVQLKKGRVTVLLPNGRFAMDFHREQ